MAGTHEQLPGWLAHAAARVTTAEGAPPAEAVGQLAEAVVEYATLILLAEAFAAGAGHLEHRAESALRRAMNVEMGAAEWRLLFEVLSRGPSAARLLGFGHHTTFGPEHPVSQATLTLAPELGEVTFAGFLEVLSKLDGEAGREALPLVVRALLAVIAESEVMSGFPLCAVEAVEPAGTRHLVRYRRVAGLGPLRPETAYLDDRPPVHEGLLGFWDMGYHCLPVPDWLAHLDPTGQLLLYGGRDAVSRQWIFRSRAPGVAPVREPRPRPGTPLVLADPTWATPDPEERRPPAHAQDTLRSVPIPGAAPTTLAGLAQRVWTARAPSGPPSRVGRPLWLLRVLNGRAMMRYADLAPGQSVILGRNPAFAGLVVHHREVSRSHARVWATGEGTVHVQDLRSTNGTSKNGEPVGAEVGTPLEVGDVIAIGPAQIRLEWSDAATLAPLHRVAALVHDASDRRDPLTHLLNPRYLSDALAEPSGSESSWSGVLLTIDRIGQLHAQHGQAVADIVFHNVAMVVMHEVETADLCTRTGFGEVLVPLPGADEVTAAEVAERLQDACAERLVFPPDIRPTLSVSVGVRAPQQTLDAWLTHLRGRPDA